MKKVAKSFLAIGVAMTFMMSAYSTVWGADDGVPNNNDEVSIKIVHTNDTHGRAFAGQDNPYPGTPSGIAGFDKVKAVANSSEFGGKKADFILDAGDLFHGLSFATMSKGESIAEVVKSVGYDAISPGNHDWNYGQAQLKKIEKEGIKILAGNIENEQGKLFENDFVVKNVEGVTVGVFGVSDQKIKKSTAPYNVEGLTFSDEIVYANQMANKLKTENGCDVVVALSHVVNPVEFASKTNGIDAVVAGHEHITLNETVKNAENKSVRVVESGYYFNNIGVLNLTYDKSTKTIKDDKNEILISAKDAGEIDISNDTEAKEVKDLMDRIRTEQKTILNEKVGETSTDLPWNWADVRVDEQPIGRLITDSYLAVSGADIAFENAGGIRAGLEKGVVTRGNVIDISPFGNYLETHSVKGSDIRTVLELSLEIQRLSKIAYDVDPEGNAYPNNSGSYLQCGGLRVEYDMEKPQGERIISIRLVKLDGKTAEFSDDEFYIVAMSNFLASSKDFPEFVASEKLSDYSSCEEAIIAYIGHGDDAIQQSVGQQRMIKVAYQEETTTSQTTEVETSKDTTEESSKAPPKTETETSQNTSEKIVTTGDSSQAYVYGIMLAVSGLVLILLKQRKMKTVNTKT